MPYRGSEVPGEGAGPAGSTRRLSFPLATSAERLLDVVTGLAAELHPGQDAPPVSLDTSLDRDLGLDSLARVELLVRVENAFDVGLPERILGIVETPRDLLREVDQAVDRHGARLPLTGPPGPMDTPGSRGTPARVETMPGVETTPPGGPGGGGGAPLAATTLVDVLEWYATTLPDRIHIRFYADEGDGDVITCRELREEAGRVAGGLQAAGLKAGESVLLMLPTSPEYFFSFFGVMLAGGVPVPVYPPGHVRQIEEHLKRHVAIAENSRAVMMITVPEASRFARISLLHLPEMRRVWTVPELLETDRSRGKRLPASRREPTETAFLQYTSGSTGTPKGVVLNHGNLLANIRAMGQAVGVTGSDVFVSWLPLYHDMGLIGAWLGSLYYGVQLVIMPPLSFIARPHRWFRAIHRYGGTLSAAPNFAFELCLRRIDDGEMEGIDLGSWRCAFNGAEAVSPRTLARFTERFSPWGFRPETMMPVFGLAENSVGLVFPPGVRRPPIDRVRRDALMSRGEAVPAPEEDATAVSFVGCGQPLRGHQVRIVDRGGRELPDRHEGRLQFQGPSATGGYYRNPAATRELFDGPWLNTGDLGYIADGDLFVTGRTKDIIIRAGRNIYPVELEEAVGAVDGVRKGAVAAFGSNDPESGTERLVILAESRKRDPSGREELRKRIVAVVNDLSGMPPDEVVLAPPNSVLKTSSGKIRRAASRESYERGEVGAARKSVSFQVLRFSLAGLLPVARRGMRSLGAGLYASYCWFAFVLTGILAWAVIALLPNRSWRWRFVRRAARALTGLVGIPIAVEGRENLPTPGQHFILASNHASYLDGLVLACAVPRDLRFVAKAELRESFPVRILLARLGTEFVERFHREKGIEDAGRLTERARGAHPLVFFPEGTLTRMPGLLPFRMGAFETAARAGLPVVPVVLRGTRTVLRAESWFPRRGRVRVIIGEPIFPSDRGDDGESAWRTALGLRDRTRSWILGHCGEPDLGHERVPIFVADPEKSGPGGNPGADNG